MERSAMFDIISFTPNPQRYYPASVNMGILLQMGNYVKHTKMDFALGASRYGGPIVDLPPGVEYPDGLRFAAQLDLAKFSPFDRTGLLPKKGQLIIFAEIISEIGEVIYADIDNNNLVRIVKEHEDNFFDGVLIDKIFADKEMVDERFRKPEHEEEKAFVNVDGKIWDYFGGSKRSKLFGLYTNCQYNQQQIEEVHAADKIVLLQVGENDFNDVGVFTVLIHKEDLKKKDFSRCEFTWAQS